MTKTMTPLAIAALLAIAACGSGGSPARFDGGGFDSSVGGVDAGGDSSVAATGCPTVNLPATVPLTYSGDTTGKPNLVTSNRLEFKDAPDDALLFIAPSQGTYRISLPASAGSGCGASAQEYDDTVYDESWCPATRQVKEIDGIYTALAGGTHTDLPLAQGQHVLVWISCAYWSTAQTGPYTITIERQ